MSAQVSRRTVLGGLAIATVAAGVPLAAPARSAAPDRFIMGAGTHLASGMRFLSGAIETLRQSGANALRDEIPWSDVETTKGQLAVPAAGDALVTSALSAGVDPLLILDYGNQFYDGGERPTSADGIAGFVRYAEFVARHFRGEVHRFEVWNEWNIAIGGVTGSGNPADYVNLLAAVYPRLKAVDPTITVVGGAVAGLDQTYIDGLLAAGILQHCDVFSVHPYIYGDLPLERRLPEVWWQDMQDLGASLRAHHGGADFPVYVTEIGWPTQIDNRGISQELAAAYCSRLYLLARTLPFLRGLWWYDFQDDGWAYDYNENNFGLVRADLTPKAAFHAFRAVSDAVKGSSTAAKLDTGDPNTWALRMDSDLLAVWNATLDDDWSVVLRDAGGRRPVQVAEAGRPAITRSWGRKAWYDDGDAAPDELDVTVRRVPVLIAGSLATVSVADVIKRTFPENGRTTAACKPGPDMVVTDITWQPATPKVGDAITFTAAVTNQGNQATPDGVITGVSFEVNYHEVSWSDTEKASIPPGGTADCGADAGPDGDSTWTPTASGSYSITAIVNDIFRYPEADELNNTLTTTLVIPG